jgi:hypothetical protein
MDPLILFRPKINLIGRRISFFGRIYRESSLAWDVIDLVPLSDLYTRYTLGQPSF